MPEHQSSPHMSSDAFRAHADELIEWIAAYWASLDPAASAQTRHPDAFSLIASSSVASERTLSPVPPSSHLAKSHGVSSDPFPVQSRVKPGELLAALPAAPPSHPEPFDHLLRDLDSLILPGLTHWQSPSFFAYFPANGSPPAVLADLLSTSLGVNGMLWATSPAATELEIRMLDWTADLIGLPEAFGFAPLSPSFPSAPPSIPSPTSPASGDSPAPRGGGVIQATASESTLVALLAARHRALRRLAPPASSSAPPDSSRASSSCAASDAARLVVYTSTQAHSSVIKAAMVAGLAAGPDDRRRLRLIDTDEHHAMRADLLDEVMRRDADAGLVPAYVCATIGTTSSGAVDPIEKIGAVCAEHNAWLHVDAAWAGSACVCPEHRGLLRGVELADSFCFNPHKWLLTSFDCSLFWTRDRDALTSSLTITPEYLRNAATDAGAVIDYRDWQIPLGRRFRALKLWFVLRSYGVEGLRAHIREHVRLAELFEQWVRADDRFELPAPRSLALICFRLKGPPSATPSEVDALNRRLLAAVNAPGGLYLTHTALPSPAAPVSNSPGPRQTRIVLRMAIGSTTTAERHVRAAWEAIRRAADGVC